MFFTSKTGKYCVEPYLSICESASGITFGQACFNVCGEGCNWGYWTRPVVIKIWQKTKCLQKVCVSCLYTYRKWSFENV